MPLPSRLAALGLLLVLVGCRDAEEPPAPKPPAIVEPTEIEFGERLLRFDPRSVRIGAYGTLGIGLGSASVKIVERTAEVCRFEYEFEIEGGGTIYLVEVPLTEGPVTIRSSDSPDEVTTSFDVAKAKRIGSRSLLDQ